MMAVKYDYKYIAINHQQYIDIKLVSITQHYQFKLISESVSIDYKWNRDPNHRSYKLQHLSKF